MLCTQSAPAGSPESDVDLAVFRVIEDSTIRRDHFAARAHLCDEPLQSDHVAERDGRNCCELVIAHEEQEVLVDVKDAELLRDYLRIGNFAEVAEVFVSLKKRDKILKVGVQEPRIGAVHVRKRPRRLVDLRRGREEGPAFSPKARLGATARLA